MVDTKLESKSLSSLWLWILSLMLVAYALWITYYYLDSLGWPPSMPVVSGNTSANYSDWGSFGDYFGGLLNPAIALMGVILVAVGIRQTRIEIEKASSSFKKNLSTLDIQIFESRFFQMLQILERQRDSLYILSLGVYGETKGREVFNVIDNVVEKRSEDLGRDKTIQLLVDTAQPDSFDSEHASKSSVQLEVYDSIYPKIKKQTISYFLTLEVLVGFVQEVEDDSRADSYMKILRSQMTNQEADVVLYHVKALSDNEPLVQHCNLLEQHWR